MTTKQFSKKAAFTYGWETFKKNSWFIMGIVLIYSIAQIFPSYIGGFLIEQNLFYLGIVFILIGMVLQVIFKLGIIQILLNFRDAKKASFSDLFKSYPLFFKYIFASILYGLIVFVGTLLLIIPGIIWALQFAFCGFILVDQKASILESLRKSAEITKGHKWNLFLFLIVLILFNLLGTLAFYIGLLVTAPISALALVYVYRKLNPKSK